MIDQGFCFHAGEWNFPDAPWRGIYARYRVYEGVRGLESFEPWLARIGGKMTEEVFDEVRKEMPGEWYGFDTDALEQMLEHLLRRPQAGAAAGELGLEVTHPTVSQLEVTYGCRT
jgi:hypothetical protein